MGSIKKTRWQWTIVAVGLWLGAALAACAVDDSATSDEQSTAQELKGEGVGACRCPLPEAAATAQLSPECVALCTLPGACGDGLCNGSETQYTCPTDCGYPPPNPYCGDGVCNNGETQYSCPSDCGSSGPVCGDGICSSGESLCCPSDCGPQPIVINRPICPSTPAAQ
jgi:hypothetical protein